MDREVLRPEDLFEREYQTSSGTIGLLAEIAITGRTLHLKDIAIYPTGGRKLSLGVGEVMAIRDQLIDEIRTLGFEHVRITGTRYGGVRPGRYVDILIDAT